MMKQLINRFAKEEKGAPIIELVILIAMSALIAAFLFPQLRTNLGSWFNSMTDNFSKGIGGSSAAPTTGAATGITPPATGGWGGTP
jgi:Flp pilus assembly pilin Flp